MAAYSASSKRTSTDRRRRAARWVRLRLLCGGGVAVGAGAAAGATVAGAVVAGAVVAGAVVAASAASCAASTAPGRGVPVPRPAGGRPAPGPAAGAVGTPTSARLGLVPPIIDRHQAVS